ncbi:hypothetical protein ACGFYV_37415 [Streptomyces sp. NPDC048297]|uniref:hypothetical protein n=1 Tax=Streptomyces sp. NPDC048297 TaxID=3365531 RepID=UPI0037102EB1
MFSSPHTVSDVITHTVAAVGLWASFKDMVGMMRDRGVSALPVLDGRVPVRGVADHG